MAVPDHTYKPFYNELETFGETARTDPPVCIECGQVLGDHLAEWEIPTSAERRGLIPARFPGQRDQRGLYCPRSVIDLPAL